MEKEVKLGAGTLKVVEQRDHACVTSWHGPDSEIEVPAYIDDVPVTVIGKKAFLSKKGLRRIILPETVEQIEDWAFAYCDGLEEIEVEGQIIFGRAVFLDCKKLNSITMRDKSPELGRLLATAVTGLDASYLCDVTQAGSKDWLNKFDARLLAVLHAPDAEGYSKQVLCGEEDYGSTDMVAFLSEKRKVKARLSLVRLLNDIGLSQELSEELKEYLLAHTKGCDGEESWLVILREHGEHRDYYELFAKIGCVTGDNMDGLMRDIGEDYPEMKAYFLTFHQEVVGIKDFFDDLEL